jgi:hypothetical protein
LIDGDRENLPDWFPDDVGLRAKPFLHFLSDFDNPTDLSRGLYEMLIRPEHEDTLRILDPDNIPKYDNTNRKTVIEHRISLMIEEIVQEVTSKVQHKGYGNHQLVILTIVDH